MDCFGYVASRRSPATLLKAGKYGCDFELAATLAQSARLWKDYDPTFAADCLEKAEIAWQAALKHPDIYAEYTPGSGGPGGGPYNDDYVGDEFYWAACELYVTTGKDEYKNYLMNSPHYLEMPCKDG